MAVSKITLNFATNNNKETMNEIKINDKEYRFSLDFVVFMEDGAYVAYCPSLDISTCANTYNEAISNFYEMFQLHIETCVECGTLHDDLVAHGWMAA